MKRNSRLFNLHESYLFPEVNKRKQAFLARFPDAPLISLGVGDTTEPLSLPVAQAMAASAQDLATEEKYSGYGPEQGHRFLRERIAVELYRGHVSPDDIFVSDGAKCDVGRLQLLFGSSISIAVQDPVYPVYVDGSLLHGVTNICKMPCTPENGFFPDLSHLPPVDLIYFCSPNNPTGAAATYDQLHTLVRYAREKKIFILYDAAYASFIQDPAVPQTIYAVPGAEEVAIEINSFSKMAGFTGVRLGWTVVPEALCYEDGRSVKKDWHRLVTTLFNGACYLSQRGGEAVLKGLDSIGAQCRYYMENAALLKQGLYEARFTVYGGKNAPYLWVHTPEKASWDAFQYFLEKYQILTTPGAGFGSSGEKFLRFSAFASRKHILEAVKRITSSCNKP